MLKKNHTVRDSSLGAAGTTATVIGTLGILGDKVLVKNGVNFLPIKQKIAGMVIFTAITTALAAGIGALVGLVIKAIESKSNSK